MKKLLSCVLFGFAVDARVRAQTSVPNPQAALPSPSTASIAITGEQVAQMPTEYLGIKIGKSEFGKSTRFFDPSYTRAINGFSSLSPVPGQSCVITLGDDGTKWVPHGAGQVVGQVSEVDIDGLAKFIKLANCKLYYVAAILKNTPENAASELAYVGGAAGSNLLAVGFGNEPEGYGMTAAQYATLWNSFATAALQADSSLKFAGPDTAVASNLGVWLTAWYQENSKLPLAFGSQHFYVAGPQNCATCTTAAMLEQRTANSYWSSMILQKNAFEASLPQPLQVALTETNNFYSGGAPGVSNSYASALYAYDFVFRAAQAGFSLVQFTEDDFWSKGYSPLNIINGYTYGPRFEYYGMYMAGLAGYGPMLSTTVNGPSSIHAYTVHDLTHSGLNTALINASGSDYSLAVTLPPGLPISSCSASVLTDPAGLSDTIGSEISLQGGVFNSSAQIEMAEPFGISVTNSEAIVMLPHYSAVLLKCSTKRS